MERINKNKEKVYDTKYLEEMEQMKRDDIKLVKSGEPSELFDTDLRLREGKDYEGDTFMVDSFPIIIHQLSFRDLRRATREGMKVLDHSEIGKQMLDASRVEANKNEEKSFTFEEKLTLEEITDIEDSWLLFFTLRDGKHPKFTGHYDNDKEWFERLPNVEEFISTIRKVNGLNNEKNDVPSGEDAVKSFRDDQYRPRVKEGTDINGVSFI